MRFRILGPLRVRSDAGWLPVSAEQQRVVLAVLVASARQVVSTDRLVDAVWGHRDHGPPKRAVNTVHGYVMRLRRLLGDDVLVTRGRGYELVAGEDDIDAMVFERLVASGRRELAAGRPEPGAALLADALALWRGPAFADVPTGPTLTALSGLVASLEQTRLSAHEDHIAALLDLGRHTQVVDELHRLVDASPLRERRWALLMEALDRCGRRAEALEAFQRARGLLRAELGLEPGPQLQQVQQAILLGGQSGAEPAQSGAEPRSQAIPVVPVVPAQLPADVRGFTGRESYLEQLDDLLPEHTDNDESHPALVVSAIDGTAGVGKTALAVHWAHRVRTRFPDGQLYLNLRGNAAGPPLHPAAALARCLSALGVPADRIPVDVDEAAATYRSHLATKRMLIVLDDAGHADQVRPLLPGTPECLVVVTSRDRLGGLMARDGAARVNLDVLTPFEAHELLTRLLGADRLRSEPAAAERLAQLCGYLPLALRIVAANAAHHPRPTLAELATELAGADRLAALEVPGDPQAAVRAAFDQSYAKLPEDERRLFRRLGLVPGVDVTADAASTLLDAPAELATRLLARLADAHLVTEAMPGRYTLHDLIRLYAAERTANEDDRPDRDASLHRLYRYYLFTLDKAATVLYPQVVRLPVPADGDDEPAWQSEQSGFDDHEQVLAWLDAERPNLVAAVRHAAVHGPLPVAWRLADALRGYLYLRMHTVDWQAAAAAALAAAEADGDPHGQASARLSLATLHGVQDRYRQAIEQFEPALALARQIGWVAGEAAILGNLGAVYDELGQPGTAIDHYSDALELDRRTGRIAGQALNLDNLGLVYLRLGRFDEALTHFTEALALYRRAGSRTGEARTMANLGETYHALGRLDEATNTLTEALALHRALGSRNVEPDTICSLAAVHRDAGRHTEALAHAQDSLSLAREISDGRVEAEVLAVRASVHDRLGDTAAAVKEYHQALDLARKIGNRYIEADALIGLAELHLRAERRDLAGECADAAHAISTAGSYRVLAKRADAIRHAIPAPASTTSTVRGYDTTLDT